MQEMRKFSKFVPPEFSFDHLYRHRMFGPFASYNTSLFPGQSRAQDNGPDSANREKVARMSLGSHNRTRRTCTGLRRTHELQKNLPSALENLQTPKHVNRKVSHGVSALSVQTTRSGVTARAVSPATVRLSEVLGLGESVYA